MRTSRCDLICKFFRSGVSVGTTRRHARHFNGVHSERGNTESGGLFHTIYIPYGEKFSWDKIFADWPLAKISRKNFCGSTITKHKECTTITKISRLKFSRSEANPRKPRKFCHAKISRHTVHARVLVQMH